MVTIANGRFNLPDDLRYTKNQHIYLDTLHKRIGLDEIGYAFLQNPKELQWLCEGTLEMGQPFVAISTDRGITTLNSPCSGTIKELNTDALTLMKIDDSKQPIVFCEWSAVSGVLIKRRDFTLAELLANAPFEEENLFSDIFEDVFIPSPIREFPPIHFLRVGELDAE